MSSKTLGKTFAKTTMATMIAVGIVLFTQVVTCSALLDQSKTDPPKGAASTSMAGLELPVVMMQNVVAGTTAVGTKIRVKLVVSTLVNGVVVPEGATLSGEVIESLAKAGTEPSRLGIRVDSVRWKKKPTPGDLALEPKFYLTGWYYPPAPQATHYLSSDASSDTASNNPPNYPSSSPIGNYRRKMNPTPPPVPTPDADKTIRPTPAEPASDVSKHRMRMKDVEGTLNREGTLTLTSSRSTLKLDRSTTYVLASGELAGVSR